MKAGDVRVPLVQLVLLKTLDYWILGITGFNDGRPIAHGTRREMLKAMSKVKRGVKNHERFCRDSPVAVFANLAKKILAKVDTAQRPE